MNHSELLGSEDCLYLNVYTPGNRNINSSLPCLVWIHGGGYENGASDDYNASDLMNFWSSHDSPAVLVTVNYRLNVFGFLGTDALRERDPDGSTGNYGMQDQRLALSWVRENIAAFGGNPEKVTIFGQSAGAGAVSLHLVMPKSYGLYSGALMESGMGAFSGWSAQPMERKEFWFQQLKRQTKCPDVDCLLQLPAEQLRSAYLAIPRGVCCVSSLLGDPWIPWAPAIDGVELTAHPVELLEQGKVNPVPMVIGSTLDEGARFETVYNLSAPGFLALFEGKYGSTRAQAELYSSESHVDVPGRADGWWSAQRAVTDQNFFCTSQFAARRLRGLSTSSKVFAYLFASSLDSQVVSHNAELPFVWMNLTNASQEEKQLAADVGMSLHRFAASGDPGAAWPQVSASSAPMMLKFQVASKGGNQVVESNYRDQQCAFMLEWLRHKIGSATSVAQVEVP
eukprot:Skav201658  [mRNA]  locus=scaffold641:141714:144142:+ [translate_table: standard]